LLNETIFTSLAHVRTALVIWKDDYNTVRPHSALGNLPPAVFAELSVPGMQRDGVLRYVEGIRGEALRERERNQWICENWDMARKKWKWEP
jgi:hypothetical protein